MRLKGQLLCLVILGEALCAQGISLGKLKSTHRWDQISDLTINHQRRAGDSSVSQLELIWVGNQTACPSIYTYCGQTTNPCPYGYSTNSFGCNVTYFPDRSPPISGTCGLQLWSQYVYNATEAVIATAYRLDKSYSPFFQPASPRSYSPSSDIGLYLDRNAYCRKSFPISALTCNSPMVLMEAGALCQPTANYGWPDNWKDSIPVLNSTMVPESTVMVFLNTSIVPNCGGFVQSQASACTRLSCNDISCAGEQNAIQLQCLCKEMDFSKQCNMTGVENTALQLWVNKTCSNVPQFPSLSSNWEDTLMVENSTFQSPKRFETWPSCINGNGCGSNLTNTATTLSYDVCVVNTTTRVCNSTTLGLPATRFCSSR